MKKNPLLQSGIFCSKGSILRLPKLLQILFWLLHPSHLDTWWQFQQWTNVGSCFSKSSVSSVPSVKGEIVCTPISKGLKVQFTSWISRLTFENNICVTNTRSAIYSKKHKNGTSIKGALHKRFANAGQWGPHSHAFTTTCKSLSTVVNKSPLACATRYCKITLQVREAQDLAGQWHSHAPSIQKVISRFLHIEIAVATTDDRIWDHWLRNGL